MSETRERSALEVLRRVEWVQDEYGGWCPICDMEEEEDQGHAPDCALDAVLRATPASDGGEVRGDAPAGATLYRRRCGWCGAYEGTVDPKEPCAKDEIGYIGPHQFEVLEAVVSGSGTPPGEGKVRVAAAAYLDALDEYRQECRTRDIPLAEYDYHEWRRLAEPVTVAERRLHEALRSAPSGVEEGEAIATVARMIADAPVLGNKRDLARQILAYLRAAPVPAREGEEHGYWWCPECREEVDGSRVTYTECHDSCGREVVWKDPLPPVNEDARTRLREELEAWIAEDRPGVVRPPFPLYLDDARTVAALLRTSSGEDVRARLDQINYRWHSGAKLSDKEVGDLLGIAYTLASIRAARRGEGGGE